MAGLGGRPVHAEDPSSQLEVLAEAEKELQTFKKFIEQTTPKAREVLQRAKWLHGEAGFVHNSEQSQHWAKIVNDATELRKCIDEAYSKVLAALESVKRARGVSPSVAALGFTTPDQALARSAYAKKYKQAFEEAKAEHFKLCGYPDGVLSQTMAIHKRHQRMSSE